MKDPRFTIGCITQLTETGVKQTVDWLGDVTTRAVNVQAAQMEEGVRAKLIELGWTPPRDPAMTTTEEVPMPEPVAWRQQFGVFEHAKWHYFHGSLDPREVHDNGKPCEPVYTPDQLRAYADARCAKLQEECDALAEKVKAMEDNDRRYRWLRDEATWTLTADEHGCKISCYLHGVTPAAIGPGNDDFDAAIDAAGGDQC